MDYNEFPNINQRMLDLTRRVREQETAPRLYAAGIGGGGLTVNKGGSIHVRGGDINAMTGGDVVVGSGGSINVLENGQIVSEGAAKFSGTSQFKGNTRIDGSLSIQGSVKFPDGKLDGTLLKNQFSATSHSVSRQSYSGAFTGDKTVITKSISIPSWADYMFIMMTGVGTLSGAAYAKDYVDRTGFTIQVYADTLYSAAGSMFLYADASTLRAEGEISSIKRINVSSKSSINAGVRMHQPGSGGTGTVSFYATTIFMR